MCLAQGHNTVPPIKPLNLESSILPLSCYSPQALMIHPLAENLFTKAKKACSEKCDFIFFSLKTVNFETGNRFHLIQTN